MDDLVIHRDTQAARKHPAGHLISLECRHGAAAPGHISRDAIKITSSDTRAGTLLQLGQHVGHDDIGGAHDLDFSRSFQEYHPFVCSCSSNRANT